MKHKIFKIYIFVLIFMMISITPIFSYGQYNSNPSSHVTLEEQLKLAKEKISNAQQAGAYGSGTSMFGYNLDNTMIMIIIIGVIMGGASAAFFLAANTKIRKKVLTPSNTFSNTDKGSTFMHENEIVNNDSQILQQQIADLRKTIEDLQMRMIK